MADAREPALGRPSPGRPGAGVATVAGLAALVSMPVLVAIGILVRTPWHPFIDAAVHELRVRDVMSTDPPLLGPAATFDGIQGELNHPGPMVFVAYALAYVVSGGSSFALGVGAALINLAALVGALVVAFRRGGVALTALTAVVLAVLVHGIGLRAMVDSWNPLVATLPMLVLVLLAWSLAVGDLEVAPAAVLVGSFVAQAHLGLLGYTAVLVAVVGVGAPVAGRRRWRATDPDDRPALARRWRHLGLAALAVGVVCWLPPLVEQVTAPDGGNLGRVASSLTTERVEPVAGRRVAVQTMASELGTVPPWVVPPERATGFVPTVGPSSAAGLLVPAVSVVVAAGLAWRGRRRDTLVLLGIVGALVAVAVPVVASISGPIHAHYVRALWVIGAALWLSVLWSILQAVMARPRGRRGVARAAVPVSTVLVVALGVASVVQRPDPLTSTPHLQAYAAAAEQAVGPVGEAVDGRGPVEVLGDGTTEGWAAQTALQLQLEKAGVPITVLGGRRVASVYGTHRTDVPPAMTVEIATGRRVDDLAGRTDLVALHTGTTDDGVPVVVSARR
jgi:hypothetical protein